MSGVKPVTDLFASELSVVNLGLESFAENLRECGAPAVQVRWKPPAGGDARMIAALDRIARSTRGLILCDSSVMMRSRRLTQGFFSLNTARFSKPDISWMARAARAISSASRWHAGSWTSAAAMISAHSGVIMPPGQITGGLPSAPP